MQPDTTLTPDHGATSTLARGRSDTSLERPAAVIDESAPAGTFTLLSVVNVVLRHRLLVAAPAILCVAIALGLTLTTPRHYSSTSAIMPQSTRQSGLSGLAAQLGVNVPISDGGQSPAFYVELLTSRSLLDATVNTAYPYERDGKHRSGTLVDIYRITGGTPALQRERAVTVLSRNVNAAPSQKSGLVRLTTTAPTPELAQAINARMLELLNSFNVTTRQSRASSERQFAGRRLEEVRIALMDAENRLMAFYQSNRNYQNSPQLTFAQERLSREVSRQQQLYTSLSQAYEQAKLEEVRDTPVLTTVEAPNVPARPDSRGLIRRTLVGLLVGLTIGLFLAFARALLGRASDVALPEYEEFVALRSQLARDLRSPHRLLRRNAGRSDKAV